MKKELTEIFQDAKVRIEILPEIVSVEYKQEGDVHHLMVERSHNRWKGIGTTSEAGRDLLKVKNSINKFIERLK